MKEEEEELAEEEQDQRRCGERRGNYERGRLVELLSPPESKASEAVPGASTAPGRCASSWVRCCVTLLKDAAGV